MLSLLVYCKLSLIYFCEDEHSSTIMHDYWLFRASEHLKLLQVITEAATFRERSIIQDAGPFNTLRTSLAFTMAQLAVRQVLAFRNRQEKLLTRSVSSLLRGFLLFLLPRESFVIEVQIFLGSAKYIMSVNNLSCADREVMVYNSQSKIPLPLKNKHDLDTQNFGGERLTCTY